MLVNNIKQAGTQHGPLAEVEADQVAKKYSEAFTLFSLCHKGYNSSRRLTDSDLKQIGKHNKRQILLICLLKYDIMHVCT